MLLLSCIILPGRICFAQTPIQVSDPILEVNDNVVHISYDILNGLLTDRYIVSLEILDANDGLIVAKSLEGDIGDNVTGGTNKKIKWDLQADSIYMDADIFIKVKARLIPQSESVTVNTYRRSGLIIQSLALPGSGLSRISGKPHWIKGAVGYGCIAGSVVFNRKAISAYEDYLSQVTAGDAQELYHSSNQQDVISEVLGYAAIGIWVTDILWTVIGTADVTSGRSSGTEAGFSLATSVEPVYRIPSIGFRYTFK